MKPLTWVLLAGLLAGCSQGPSTPQPPDLKLGEMACSRCGMSIDDGKFAAARQVGDKVRVYDDLGELFLERAEKPADPEYLWVRSFIDEKWLDARGCAYVRGDKIHSPMGFSIAAAADELAGAPLAARWHARLLTFEEIQSQFTTQEEK